MLINISRIFILLINIKMPTFKMPTIVGILTFMSRINFVLRQIEHGKSFITSGPGLFIQIFRAEKGSSIGQGLKFLFFLNCRNRKKSKLLFNFFLFDEMSFC